MCSDLTTAQVSSLDEQTVIEVHGISKCYHSYQKPLHRLFQIFYSKATLYDECWALKGVDLTVKKGETVGIVGRNGSGKSTLLQIITGILKPTSGECRTQGRISALLELGAGFNPEFTGLENARLNASIMGLSREEFHDKLPDIVDFCGLGEFLHRPVKTYSSGMFVRLAFAVAINMNPDILIIDEALAVGDVRFQRKCFRRLDELKNQGVSILFVTHSTDSVINHCDRAVLIDQGELLMNDTPKAVVQAYLEMMFASDFESPEKPANVSVQSNEGLDPGQDYCPQQPSYNKAEHRWGDRRAEIFNYSLRSQAGNDALMLQRGESLSVVMQVVFHQDLADLIYGLTVKTADGNAVYGTNTRLAGLVCPEQKAGDVVKIQFDLNLNLLAGDYFISLGVAQDNNDKDNIGVDRRYDLIHIRVDTTPSAFGHADLACTIEIEEAIAEGDEGGKE